MTMEISQTFMIAIYVAFGLFILYKLFFSRNPYEEEYERLYNEILTSDKYKVKGQYEKRE